MDTIFRSCCGLDVHSKSIAACVRRMDERGRVSEEVRSFGTVTRNLLMLRDWLEQEHVTHVAMESTGVFWKPVFNILESGLTVLLVNARDVKHVPGRKTDVKDCQWLAQLLQCGLLKASFVPPVPQRDLRDLTRHRAQLVGEHSRVTNRVHKTLEDANVQLGDVASDILGASGRAMLRALADGQTDVARLADLAQGRLREKIPQLCLALEGHMREHHRFMLRSLLDHLKYLEDQIERFDERIEELMGPFEKELRLLKGVPGFGDRTAQNVLAEIGVNMGQFPSHDHLSSWAGMCPGNNESAGKRKSGKTTKGSRWLRQTLVQAAWAASRKKKSYFHAQYRRLAGRRGKKRALVAVAHSLLVVIYHVLKTGTPYQELGPDYFDRLDPKRLTRYHVKRLEALGYQVTLAEAEAAA
jgi:transposase